MALDPEEVVTLTDHGTMTLRSAVARAMMLPPQERHQASIIRDSEPSILDFHLIRHLAARWDGRPHCLSDSEMATGAFYLRHAGMALAGQDEYAAAGGPGWGSAPRFRQSSGLLMPGDASCHSP
jgi:hypothetical protein